MSAKDRSDSGRHRDIVGYIQALIHKQRIKPGNRLPSERAMAAMFHVSRNSVREAIRALVEQGVLSPRRGDGTYLASGAGRALTTLAGASEARRRLKDIFELRRMLEPEIASLAAERIGSQAIGALKLIVFEQQRCMLTGKDDTDQDRAFHLGLARATGNRVIQEVIDILEEIVGESRSPSFKSLRRQRASVQAHVQIVDAVERGDRQGAREAMIQHLTEVEATVAACGKAPCDRLEAKNPENSNG